MVQRVHAPPRNAHFIVGLQCLHYKWLLLLVRTNSIKAFRIFAAFSTCEQVLVVTVLLVENARVIARARENGGGDDGRREGDGRGERRLDIEAGRRRGRENKIRNQQSF